MYFSGSFKVPTVRLADIEVRTFGLGVQPPPPHSYSPGRPAPGRGARGGTPCSWGRPPSHCDSSPLQHCETLEVKCRGMTLEVTLRGEGVEPLLTCCCPDGDAVGAGPGGGLLDFGYTLQKEGAASRVLKVRRHARVGPWEGGGGGADVCGVGS